jgi:protein TonB
MFQNLIESTTHRVENKRRASFLLGTTAMYGLILLAGGIASVFAYDAHLENQNLELVTLVQPVAPAEKPEPERPRPATAKPSQDQRVSTVTEYNTMNPLAKPDKIVAVAHNVAPPNVKGKLGAENYIAPKSNLNFDDGPDNSIGGDDGDKMPPPPPVKTAPPPQPPPKVVEPEPKPTPKAPTMVSEGVVNGKAIHLPKPAYSAIARTAGAQGVVQVQVTIDETGKVISARALSGHPLLTPEAVRAAYQARFSITYLSRQPVKVSGVINYNFQR